jgi:hypothetical protein
VLGLGRVITSFHTATVKGRLPSGFHRPSIGVRGSLGSRHEINQLGGLVQWRLVAQLLTRAAATKCANGRSVSPSNHSPALGEARAMGASRVSSVNSSHSLSVTAPASSAGPVTVTARR